MKPSPERVAYRFLRAAGDPSPSALRLLKVMAEGGKTGMININLLEEVLKVIGWSITEKNGAARLTSSDQLEKLMADFLRTNHGAVWGYDSVKEPKEFWFNSEASATAGKAALLRAVDQVPASGPSHPEHGKLYFAVVEEPVPDQRLAQAQRWVVRTQFWWLGVPSWTLSNGSASGEIVLGVDQRGRMADVTAMKMPGFWTWAYKNGLQAAAKAFLDSMGTARVDEATRPESARTLDNTGTCPCCFANVKLASGKVMRHGWQVQGQRGWGQYGNSWHSHACFGFQHQPFEVSKYGTESYLKDAVQPSLTKAEERLAELRRLPDTLTYKGRQKLETVSKPEGFVLDHSHHITNSYGDILKRQLTAVAADINGLQDLQRTLEAKIQAWTPQPLPGSR